MIKQIGLIKGLFIIIFFLAFSFSFASQKKVVIAKCEDFASYKRALKGIKTVLEDSDLDIRVTEYIIPDEPEERKRSLEKLVLEKPDLIITIGSKATEIVSKKIKDTPVVFTVVLNPVISGFVKSMQSSGNNLTGASLDIPIRIQLEKFKLVVPNLRKIGALHTSETEELIKEAKAVAENLNLEIVPFLVFSEREVPEALEQLQKKTQGLWAIADPNIYTPQTTQFILLYALRNRLPVMGVNPSFVENGALFTLACDYKDIGRQSGEVALEILLGKDPKLIPVLVPRIIYLYLNLKTAEHIDLEISSDLISIAKEIFR